MNSRHITKLIHRITHNSFIFYHWVSSNFFSFNKIPFKVGEFLKFEDERKNWIIFWQRLLHIQQSKMKENCILMLKLESRARFSSVKMKQPTSMIDTLYLILCVYLHVSHLRFSLIWMVVVFFTFLSFFLSFFLILSWEWWWCFNCTPFSWNVHCICFAVKMSVRMRSALTHTLILHIHLSV